MHINLAYHTSRGTGGVPFFYQKFCLVERKKTLTNCLQLVGIYLDKTDTWRVSSLLPYFNASPRHSWSVVCVSIPEIPKRSLAH